jgi:predicted RNA-binding Zn ribbon-like protein
MNGEENPLAGLSLIGGRTSLNFANTVGQRGDDDPHDRLRDYDDLVWWGVRAGILSEREAGEMLSWAGRNPEAAARLFARALRLREAIYRAFSEVAAGVPIREGDLEVLNVEVAAALSHARLRPTPAGFVWSWGDAEGAQSLLWTVARDAAELLTSDLLTRVGECAGEHCGWLFVDESKNRSRRWCDMKDCGNRAKSRRHYGRRRSAE